MQKSRRGTAFTGPDRRIARPSPVVIGLAVLGVCAIAYATLCPIGMRPHLASADQERFCAYFVLGLLMASAAPRRWITIMGLVVLVAVGLEASQLFIPGRDARVSDALVKAVGGALGAQARFSFYATRRMLRRSTRHIRKQARKSPPNSTRATFAS